MNYRHPETACSWCRLVLTWVTTASLEPPLISHGMCAKCDGELNEQLHSLTAVVL